MNGVVLYRGPSEIDGNPVVCILTGLARRSKNPKTGDMLQTWVLREDVHPVEALGTGADESICGSCPHRGKLGKERTCYVNILGPSAIWRAYKAGNYPDARVEDLDLVHGRAVRFGAYGDPAAVPTSIWAALAERASTYTGYTHQWRRRPSLQPYCMASVDNGEEFQDARAAGWRTFRIIADTPKALAALARSKDEILCPNTTRAIQCIDCGLCKGTGSGARSIAIPVHGIGAANFQG